MFDGQAWAHRILNQIVDCVGSNVCSQGDYELIESQCVRLYLNHIFLESSTQKIKGKARDQVFLDLSKANSLQCYCESKKEKQTNGQQIRQISS